MVVSSSWQQSLFGAQVVGPPGIDSMFAGLVRTELGAGAWIDRCPGWLSSHAAVFDALRRGLRWHQQEREMYGSVVAVPRLVATLGEDGPGPPVLAAAAAALTRRYDYVFDHTAAAYYRDGRDSVAPHGDRVRHDRGEALVAIVAVGEPRRLLLKPVGAGPSLAVSMGWGDLLVMGGTCQRTFLHGIPKVARAGPRISVVFRGGDPPPSGPHGHHP